MKRKSTYCRCFYITIFEQGKNKGKNRYFYVYLYRVCALKPWREYVGIEPTHEATNPTQLVLKDKTIIESKRINIYR